MQPHEYEQYVARLIKELDSFKTGKLYTNKKFPGIRQPGFYEVDVAVEIDFDEIAKFLIIVECKNWTRPVDRPVVQKLIQTREAIAAHKAAIASPVGFSKEAVEVADANGVALWVIAENKNISAILHELTHPWINLYHSLRKEFYVRLGFQITSEIPEATIVEYKYAKNRLASPDFGEYEAYIEELERPDMDGRTALFHLYAEITQAALSQTDNEKSEFGRVITKWRKDTEERLTIGLVRLLASEPDLDYAGISKISKQIVTAVISGDPDEFHLLFSSTLSNLNPFVWHQILDI